MFRCYQCNTEINIMPCPTCERNRLLAESNNIARQQYKNTIEAQQQDRLARQFDEDYRRQSNGRDLWGGLNNTELYAAHKAMESALAELNRRNYNNSAQTNTVPNIEPIPAEPLIPKSFSFKLGSVVGQLSTVCLYVIPVYFILKWLIKFYHG